VRPKTIAIAILKFAISLGIIAYLAHSARSTLANFHEQPKDLRLLGLGWALSMLAVCVSFFRWFLLVRALGLAFRVQDAFRLGFLGYLLNFISVGSIGGDLFKAVFIAHEQRGHRAEAVASVIVDRIVGMYALLIVGTLGAIVLLVSDQPRSDFVNGLIEMTMLGLAIATVIVILLIGPSWLSRRLAGMVRRLPLIGRPLGAVVRAAHLYHGQWGVLLCCTMLSLISHSLSTLTIYSIARGLPEQQPTLSEHFVIVPLGNAAAALPLPMGALGTTEYVLDKLYQEFADSKPGVGLMAALGYRLVTLVIAGVGACYYLASRRTVAAVLEEAELDNRGPIPDRG
jgi:glycosyltransferase 2 family protein